MLVVMAVELMRPLLKSIYMRLSSAVGYILHLKKSPHHLLARRYSRHHGTYKKIPSSLIHYIDRGARTVNPCPSTTKGVVIFKLPSPYIDSKGHTTASLLERPDLRVIRA